MKNVFRQYFRNALLTFISPITYNHGLNILLLQGVNDGKRSTEDNDYIAVAGEIFETGYNVPNDRSYDQLKQELNLALQRVLVDGMDPMESLKQAEVNFNKANNR